MKIRLIGATVTAIAILGVGFTGATQAAQPSLVSAAKKYTTITLNQGVPKLSTTTFNFGSIPETMVIFSAPLTNAKGAPFGEVVGGLNTFDITLEQLKSETRYRELTFILPGGQIVANGTSEYVGADTELQANAPVTIAVIGGTGKYIGARGEVTTRRNSDGTYRHILKLLK